MPEQEARDWGARHLAGPEYLPEGEAPRGGGVVPRKEPSAGYLHGLPPGCTSGPTRLPGELLASATSGTWNLPLSHSTPPCYGLPCHQNEVFTVSSSRCCP